MNETDSATGVEPLPGWNVLIVDDDQDVHSVTELVMHGVSILGRSLVFLHAYSAAQARQMLAEKPDIAVILLDVVMESEDAGLTLVHIVREELKLKATRIILRTGQPGYAPEYEAIRDYDINDYRTKSELSYARLLTSLTSAIRSYTQIKAITESSNVLEFIIQSAPGLLTKNRFEEFEAVILEMLPGVLNHEVSALLIHVTGEESEKDPALRGASIHGGSGAFAGVSASHLPADLSEMGEAVPAHAAEMLRSSLKTRSHQFNQTSFVLHFFGDEHGDLLLYGQQRYQLESEQRRLLEVLAVAVSMGYQNVNLVTRLQTLAFKDSLTGLLNRTGFIQAVNHIRREQIAKQNAVLVDIEGFSELNEVLGHEYGDDLLRAVASRLQDCFDEPVVCARVGADGFVLLGRGEVIQPEIIQAIFAKPFSVQQHSMYLRMVAGFVRLDEVSGDGADLLKDAYLAVKSAKLRQQNRYAFYDPRVEIENRNRVIMLEDLQRALEGGLLSVYYQPQVSMVANGAVTGFEALIRWKQKDGSFVPPAVFIPLAEQSGLIVEIGEWLVHEVLKQLRSWEEQGFAGFRVAINISVRQFYSPSFIPNLQDQMRSLDVDATRLELEITESMAMNAVDEVIAMLQKLRDIGFKIALDDFGTGFSSLSYLQRLPIDRIKIDRAFVMTIHQEEKQRTIAQTIVAMGQNLGLELIAEGVEETSQADILVRLGCPEAQGYLYGRPMDVPACSAWLAERVRPGVN